MGQRRPAICTSLASESAAFDLRDDVKAAERIGRCERLLDGGDVGRAREVIAQSASIDLPFSGAGLQIQSAARFLAPPDGVRGCRAVSHYLFSPFSLRSRTFGC